MSLALKKEAVAVASGNNVYAYSYSGSVTKLAERSGDVLGLTVYRGTLLDSGKHDGVRSTLEKRTKVAGKGAQWRRIAVTSMWDSSPKLDVILYGAMETNDKEKYGIYELICSEGNAEWHKRYYRNGRTNVLRNWHVLVDAGDYKFGHDCKPHLALRSTFDEEDLGVFRPVDFLPISDEEYYYCEPREVFREHPDYIFGGDPRYGNIFKLKTGLDGEYVEIVDVLLRRDEIAYRRFNRALFALKQKVPHECFIYGDGKEIHPLTYSPDSDNLWMLGRQLRDNLDAYLAKTMGLTSLALADGQVFAGQANGNLIVPSSEMQDTRSNVLYQFPHPINALCTIPEELFDGLRQRVVRSIQMKAIHARASMAARRRAA